MDIHVVLLGIAEDVEQQLTVGRLAALEDAAGGQRPGRLGERHDDGAVGAGRRTWMCARTLVPAAPMFATVIVKQTTVILFGLAVAVAVLRLRPLRILTALALAVAGLALWFGVP